LADERSLSAPAAADDKHFQTPLDPLPSPHHKPHATPDQRPIHDLTPPKPHAPYHLLLKIATHKFAKHFSGRKPEDTEKKERNLTPAYPNRRNMVDTSLRFLEQQQQALRGKVKEGGNKRFPPRRFFVINIRNLKERKSGEMRFVVSNQRKKDDGKQAQKLDCSCCARFFQLTCLRFLCLFLLWMIPIPFALF